MQLDSHTHIDGREGLLLRWPGGLLLDLLLELLDPTELVLDPGEEGEWES